MMAGRQGRGESVAIAVTAPTQTPAATMAESQNVCGQCGAVMAFQPGSSAIRCEYCGSVSEVEAEHTEIFEFDLKSGLEQTQAETILESTATVTCQSCQAVFTFDENQHAGDCPFCGHAIVKGTGEHRQIKPTAILPFALAQAQARANIGDWLGTLWFAPGKLRNLARRADRLHGIYLPYWTFDSDVTADYRGERGDIYWEPQQVRIVKNGRESRQERMVRKVRWRPADGRVNRYFNDVLVIASQSLPDWMATRLGPWNLGDLRPYSPLFVQGFQAQSYNIALAEGFESAQQTIKSMIQADIRARIGGDLQKIHTVQLQHAEAQFKHVLLPLWLGVYRYRNKVYHIAVNGQTGEVQGERPYSKIKLLLAVLGIAIVLGALGYALYLSEIDIAI